MIVLNGVIDMGDVVAFLLLGLLFLALAFYDPLFDRLVRTGPAQYWLSQKVLMAVVGALMIWVCIWKFMYET